MFKKIQYKIALIVRAELKKEMVVIMLFARIFFNIILKNINRICKYNWCWLCRSKFKRKHYNKFNTLGCPAYYAKKEQWPM